MKTEFYPQILSLAPAWKRLIAYLVDLTFLHTLVIFLIISTYGREFSLVFNYIEQHGAMEYIIKEGLFKDKLEIIQASPVAVQNMLYLQHYIFTQYFYLVFVFYNVLSIIYYALFWMGTGQTLGAKLLNIKVISVNGEPISLASSIMRSLGLKIIEMCYGIPALFMINPIYKQYFHDKISNSVVIENKDWQNIIFEKPEKEKTSENIENH